MLSSLILASALLSGAPEPPSALPSGVALPSAELYRIIPQEDNRGGMIGDFFPLGAPDGVRDAVILMDHGGTILVTNLALFDIDTVNLELRLRVAADEDKPVVFRTVYVDAAGRTHEVVTDCRKYSTYVRCAEQHGLALEALESIFPPGDMLIQFNETNPRFQHDEPSRLPERIILPGLVITVSNPER